MNILLAKKDLTTFSNLEIKILKKYYQIDATGDDLLWLIALSIHDSRSEMSGMYKLIIQRYEELRAASKRNKDPTFPNISNNYVEELQKFIKQPGPKKSLQAVEKQLQDNPEWSKLQTIAGYIGSSQLADPKWIINAYIKGCIKKLYVSQLQQLIKTLNKIKLVDKNTPAYSTFCGVDDLREYIAKHEHLLVKDDYPEMPGEYNVLLRSPQVTVIVPKTERAACYFGRHTKWCTASGENSEFHHMVGDLYIVIPTVPKYKDEKYQLEFNSNQFMNEKDVPINYMKLLEEYPDILQIPEMKILTPELQLHQAVVLKDVSEVKKLLANGVNPNNVRIYDLYYGQINPILDIADVEIAKLILDAGFIIGTDSAPTEPEEHFERLLDNAIIEKQYKLVNFYIDALLNGQVHNQDLTDEIVGWWIEYLSGYKNYRDQLQQVIVKLKDYYDSNYRQITPVFGKEEETP